MNEECGNSMLNSRLARVGLILGFAVVFAAAPVRAQDTAAISGKVEDSSGAAVPGATVTVKSIETGAARTVTTDLGGNFAALSLPLGPQEVKEAEELMMLIVMSDADQRRWRPAESTAMLVAGMADDAGDLIIDLVCEQHRRGDGDQEMGDQPIGLQEKIVDQAIAVVGPDHRCDRQMVPPMHAPIKKPGVNQPVQPIEPGVEQHQRGNGREHCPADAGQRPQSPAESGV